MRAGRRGGDRPGHNLLPSVYGGRAHGHTRTDGRRLPNGVWVMSGDEFILSDRPARPLALAWETISLSNGSLVHVSPMAISAMIGNGLGVRIVPLISYRYSSSKTTIGEKRTAAFSNANWVSK